VKYRDYIIAVSGRSIGLQMHIDILKMEFSLQRRAYSDAFWCDNRTGMTQRNRAFSELLPKTATQA